MVEIIFKTSQKEFAQTVSKMFLSGWVVFRVSCLLLSAKNSECNLSNGWSRSCTEIKLLLSARIGCSRSYRVTNPHPNLPWNFMAHGLLDPSAFPDSTSQLVLKGQNKSENNLYKFFLVVFLGDGQASPHQSLPMALLCLSWQILLFLRCTFPAW